MCGLPISLKPFCTAINSGRNPKDARLARLGIWTEKKNEAIIISLGEELSSKYFMLL